MLKLRLKRVGKKRSPSYRLVIMENTFRRDGRPIDELGYYNPLTKNINLILKNQKSGWVMGLDLETVMSLLKKADC
jgi:small subunit ribosomal protein S16